MKKLVFILLLTALFLGSCQKNNPIQEHKNSFVLKNLGKEIFYGTIYKPDKIEYLNKGFFIAFKSNDTYHLVHVFLPKNVLDYNTSKLQSFFKHLPINFSYNKKLHFVKFTNGTGEKWIFTTSDKAKEKFQGIPAVQIGVKWGKNHLKLDAPNKNCKNCTSGGEGATSCGVNDTFSGCSVSCGSGYYACCDGDSNTCHCCKD